MLCAHRLPAVRVCLLILGVVLAVSIDPSRAAVASSHSPRAGRRVECVVATHGNHRKAATRGKRRKAGKLCAGKKPKTSRTKRSISRKRPAPRKGGSQPSEISKVPGSAPDGPAPPSEPTLPVKSPQPVESAGPSRFFSPTSFWNEPLPANAPLDSSSVVVVGALNTEIGLEKAISKGPAINTTSWSVPIYTVPARQPTVRVSLVYASSPALQAAWAAVPLPADAQPAGGTDRHLVVWQPSTDRLWEFYALEHGTKGWQADWGGAIQSVSTNSGAYGPGAWPGATTTWGASASSLSIAGGLITLEDLERGQIDHALAMALPTVRGGVYSSPAERSDGAVLDPLYLPEGAHLRLDPKLNLTTLRLPRLTLMMAEAAQRYGIVVRDYADNVAFYAQDPVPTGTEPYTGSGGYYGGRSPGELLAAFPWSHLQLLKMELHSTS
jgi:hypothetical protein